MLTRIRIRNFKHFDEADIELGQAVVFVGPNNSGKTTALQALALWGIGVRRFSEKRAGREPRKERVGVPINRKDLVAIPVRSADLLWHALHLRRGRRENGKTKTENVRIEIVVDGVTGDEAWSCGFEFDYANDESLYCRPLRTDGADSEGGTVVPKAALEFRFAFLPAMSGLAAEEPKLEPGYVNVLIGQGQTAQVLRNLCHQVCERDPARWRELVATIARLFGVELRDPRFVIERGQLELTYVQGKIELDIASSGRGLQQVLLLLAHLHLNPGTVLLLDEPDAHLEVLRQREVYSLLTDVARRHGSQVVAATHSEVVLSEAADKDVVIAFVGRPHRVDDRSQLRKALTEIGFDQYVAAEQTGFVLYAEGPTDLAILRAFARRLSHPATATAVLDRPFFRAMGNNVPNLARSHFFALREAFPALVGVAVFDRIDKPVQSQRGLSERCWQRREIENYVCQRETLVRFAAAGFDRNDLFDASQIQRHQDVMNREIDLLEQAMSTQRKPGPWSPECKVTDEFLDPLFANYHQALGLPDLMRKSDYHALADHVPLEAIDPEITAMLDLVVEVASRAQPRRGGPA